MCIRDSSITINPVNDAPVLSGVGDLTVDEDQSVIAELSQ